MRWYITNEIENYHLRIQNLIMTAGENINLFHYFKHTNVLSTLIQAWIDLRLLFLVCCVSPYIQGLCFPSKCKKPSFFLEIHSPILQEGNGPTRLMVICLAIAYWLSIMQNSKIFGSRMLHLQFWQSYQNNISFSKFKVSQDLKMISL